MDMNPKDPTMEPLGTQVLLDVAPRCRKTSAAAT